MSNLTDSPSFKEILQILKQDFKRSENFQSRLLLIIIRMRYFLTQAAWFSLIKYPLLILTNIAYFFYVKIGHNCDISAQSFIGPGLKLVHPYNIIIADGVKIGSNCKILHEVTLGWARRKGEKGVPLVGDDVDLNAGAKLIGPIKVGNGCRIGVNAVVFEDISEFTAVVNKVEMRTISIRHES